MTEGMSTWFEILAVGKMLDSLGYYFLGYIQIILTCRTYIQKENVD
jgi:hypothetical protein